MINMLTENRAGVRYAERRHWDTKSRLLASVDKAHALFGYEPSTTLEDGLRATVRWFRDNWDLIEGAAHFEPGSSSAVRGVVTPNTNASGRGGS